MNFVALKMLVGDKLKYLALVAGVAFAALLITQQASIFAGFTLRTGAWIRETAYADLWVCDSQVEFADDMKPMSETALQRVRGVDGVQWAVPLYKSYVKCRLGDGSRVTVRLVGLDDATLVGGPPRMIQGRIEDLRRDRAIIVNQRDASGALALHNGFNRPLQVGDRVDINDHEAIVVGIYHASKEFFWDPVLYTTYSKAVKFVPQERRLLNFILVKAKPGADLPALQQRIAQSTGLSAHTNAQFERMTANYMLEKTGILVNFGVTIGLGFLIGILVAGQTFYTFVLENLRHFAALKAMGAGNGTILRMMCIQVVLVGTIGYGLGLGVTSITGIFLGNNGALAFQMPWQIPAVGGIAVVLCCMVAGCLGMWRVLRLEPSVVFR